MCNFILTYFTLANVKQEASQSWFNISFNLEHLYTICYGFGHVYSDMYLPIQYHIEYFHCSKHTQYSANLSFSFLWHYPFPVYLVFLLFLFSFSFFFPDFPCSLDHKIFSSSIFLSLNGYYHFRVVCFFFHCPDKLQFIIFIHLYPGCFQPLSLMD